ncbi:hypothetical protein Scep_021006 [Stephania cephalantha]|uniref:Exostosin GT47 domain-containing protein n=1 Tax=Stephania cephalantha TaxID=152367 RepID=A0AAP0F867_9MAGN
MWIIKNRIPISLGIFALFPILVIFLYRWSSRLAFPTISPQSRIPSSISSSCTARSPLRVFMYDLDSRFNLGMVDREWLGSNRTVSSANLPPWPSDSGMRLQHSVEYWMMASVLYEGGGEEWREAVRVQDPATAEAFFVPFFSSLSFEVHGRNMTDPATEVDRQLEEDIVQFLRESEYWNRSKGRDHVIPMHHPNAFRFLREQINASIFIVSDFGRYSQSLARLSKDVVAPYVHVVDSYENENTADPYESRTTLLFFRGGTVRKDEGYIRAKFKHVFAGEKDVVYEETRVSGENIKMSSEGMRRSKFCLHPAGDTPSSCRLFDAIVSHCIPVIVSDKIELPFEDELDYTEFALFFSVNHALEPEYVTKKLRAITKEAYLVMWRKLKSISHHFEYQYPPKKDDAVNMIWRQVKTKINAVKLEEHRNERLQIPDWWTQKRR